MKVIYMPNELIQQRLSIGRAEEIRVAIEILVQFLENMADGVIAF